MVKYAEGPTTEVAIDIAAEAATVWSLIADPGFPAGNSDELQEAEWNPDGPPPGVGAEILGRNINPAVGQWRTTSWVTVWDEGRELSWVVADRDQPAAQWWFTLDPADQGGVRLTQRVRLGPGPSGLSPAIAAMPDREDDIVARRLSDLGRNMQANLDAVKQRCEAAGDS